MCDTVCPPEITTPATVNGPIDMIFGYIQYGQYTHPMGSGRPPWAAGEQEIVVRSCKQAASTLYWDHLEVEGVSSMAVPELSLKSYLIRIRM